MTWDKDDDSIPPHLDANLLDRKNENFELCVAAKTGHACLVKRKGTTHLEGKSIVDFGLSCWPTTMEREAREENKKDRQRCVRGGPSKTAKRAREEGRERHARTTRHHGVQPETN